jgi:putative hemolysin
MLRRTSFKRPARERERVYPSAIPEHLRRTAVMCTSAANEPIPKAEPVRSEPYRRLVASMDCIHCGKQGRSQHAHTNEGKGKSLKNDDRDAMPWCADEPGLQGCHAAFDQYILLDGGRAAHVEQGRTWAALTREAIETAGLWPQNLPKWTK